MAGKTSKNQVKGLPTRFRRACFFCSKFPRDFFRTGRSGATGGEGFVASKSRKVFFGGEKGIFSSFLWES